MFRLILPLHQQCILLRLSCFHRGDYLASRAIRVERPYPFCPAPLAGLHYRFITSSFVPQVFNLCFIGTRLHSMNPVEAFTSDSRGCTLLCVPRMATLNLTQRHTKCQRHHQAHHPVTYVHHLASFPQRGFRHHSHRGLPSPRWHHCLLHRCRGCDGEPE